MPRILVQSLTTGRFLVPGEDSPTWVQSLRDAGGGCVPDLEHAHSLIEEYAEIDDFCITVDLDRLGTANDYPQ